MWWVLPLKITPTCNPVEELGTRCTAVPGREGADLHPQLWGCGIGSRLCTWGVFTSGPGSRSCNRYTHKSVYSYALSVWFLLTLVLIGIVKLMNLNAVL